MSMHQLIGSILMFAAVIQIACEKTTSAVVTGALAIIIWTA